MSRCACRGRPTGSLPTAATSSADPASRRRPPTAPFAARTATRPTSRSTTCSARRSAARCSTAAPAASRLSSSRRSEVTAESTAIVGVIGVGTMGAGIAQVALEAGHEGVIHDVDEVAIARGRDRIRDGLARRAAKVGADGADAWVEERLLRLRDVETIAGLATEIDVAIEAAVEDLELKRDIFRALDAAASPDAILATNTSALSVAAIAEAAMRPERVVGLHFFN